MKKITKIITYIWLFLLAAVICFPVIFAISGVFMKQWELEQYLAPVLGSAEGMASWPLLPQAPTLQSLVELLIDSPQFFVMFWNSLKLSLCILAGQTIFGVPAAWALARFDFPGKKAVLMLYIVLMLMPFQVLMMPEYLVLNRIGLLDTHAAVILPAVFSTFPVFIMYRFFSGIPEAILEAARIDGAGNLQIFWHIGIPLGAAGIVSSGILGFLESWNMIEQPMTFLKTRSLWPLSLFLPEIGLKEAGMGFAAAIMMLIPALLIFLSGQEYLEQGIAAAALKE
ncbi:MAG: carbohydrate ABC transporter permease [Lachnospiraceae bacterium]|nr:carbohydrate ABC transporter permease [Lachnospiraceae bacterium]